jgi:hypothetical protein
MTEFTATAVPQWVSYRCDDCKIGEVVSTGQQSANPPHDYEHICPLCKRVHWLDEDYPTIRWERVQ